jgi:hypothetical protein
MMQKCVLEKQIGAGKGCDLGMKMGMGMIHWGRRWGQGEDGHEGDDLALGIR